MRGKQEHCFCLKTGTTGCASRAIPLQTPSWHAKAKTAALPARYTMAKACNCQCAWIFAPNTSTEPICSDSHNQPHWIKAMTFGVTNKIYFLSLATTALFLAGPLARANTAGVPAMFTTRTEAEEAAIKHFNCTGAHRMGELWMPCKSHDMGIHSASTNH